MNEIEYNVKERVKEDWALALMTQGVIAKLSVSKWCGYASLSSEELGLKYSDKSSREFMEKYITLGREKLVPPEIYKKVIQIENKARNNLRVHSFPTVWGWFVPFTAFDSWEKENQTIQQQFLSLAQEIGEDYLNITSIIKTEYKKMAQDVWKRLYPTSVADAPDSFTENFVNQIVDKIPSRIDIVSSFKYDVTYFVIPMPSIIEENISKAKKEQRDREMDDFSVDLEKRTKQKIAQAYLERKQEFIDGFLESTVVSMRGHVSKLCDSVLQSMSRHSATQEMTVKQRTKIKQMIDNVRLLNFYDDVETTTLLNNLETEVNKFKGERDNNEIVRTLQKIVEIGTEEFEPKDYNPTISALEVSTTQ